MLSWHRPAVTGMQSGITVTVKSTPSGDRYKTDVTIKVSQLREEALVFGTPDDIEKFVNDLNFGTDQASLLDQ